MDRAHDKCVGMCVVALVRNPLVFTPASGMSHLSLALAVSKFFLLHINNAFDSARGKSMVTHTKMVSVFVSGLRKSVMKCSAP